MSAITAFVRRIFGAGAQTTWNPENQEVGEALTVGTHRRIFKGPQRAGNWSYGGRMTTAGGAASALKFYYSNLPNPDPDDSNHWVDSGITGVDLTATTPYRGDVTGKFPEYIMAEMTIAVTGGAGYLWVRSEGVEV